jgi:hypothetical protein
MGKKSLDSLMRDLADPDVPVARPSIHILDPLQKMPGLNV